MQGRIEPSGLRTIIRGELNADLERVIIPSARRDFISHLTVLEVNEGFDTVLCLLRHPSL